MLTGSVHAGDGGERESRGVWRARHGQATCGVLRDATALYVPSKYTLFEKPNAHLYVSERRQMISRIDSGMPELVN